LRRTFPHLTRQTHVSDLESDEGVFVGTALYASPEQLRGEQVDARSDLWSLAVLAFECLTRERPFESHSMSELWSRVIYDQTPRFEARQRGLPPSLDRWWQQAAAREPMGRFQSAEQLVRALERALQAA
jgi:eukaryotic-like serine/threonine-protein kinase